MPSPLLTHGHCGVAIAEPLQLVAFEIVNDPKQSYDTLHWSHVDGDATVHWGGSVDVVTAPATRLHRTPQLPAMLDDS